MRKTKSVRVQKHRMALRAAGLRPVQIWVPDTRRAGFAEECHRQSLLLQDEAPERETADWFVELDDREGWQ